MTEVDYTIHAISCPLTCIFIILAAAYKKNVRIVVAIKKIRKMCNVL